RCVHHQPASFAAVHVLLKLDHLRCAQFTVQVTRKLVNYAATVHALALRSKIGLSLSRNFSRARSNRDFTAGTEIPSISAVSSVESPSTSLRMNTVRKIGSNSPIAFVRMLFSSPRWYRCSGEGPQSS